MEDPFGITFYKLEHGRVVVAEPRVATWPLWVMACSRASPGCTISFRHLTAFLLVFFAAGFTVDFFFLEAVFLVLTFFMVVLLHDSSQRTLPTKVLRPRHSASEGGLSRSAWIAFRQVANSPL